jgi:thioester reductase-like protein
MNTYFITGATGMVGSAILRELLASSEDHAVLLIRAKSPDELSGRLSNLLEFATAASERGAAGRITALCGDCSWERFGLAPHAYGNLCARVTHIIHSAGAVRMNLPIAEARRSAVGSTQEMLTFMEACRAAAGHAPKLEFVSTVGVAGRMQTPLPETWVTTPREFHNTYEQAKAEAEALLQQHPWAMDHITVHRPSMVVGDSRDGTAMHYQVFYHLLSFLVGKRTHGILPDLGNHRLDIIPADYVAKAIVCSSRRQKAFGKIVHLCAGPARAVKLHDLQLLGRERLTRLGVSLSRPVTIPANLFRRLIPLVRMFVDGRSRRAIDTLPIFLDYLATDSIFLNEKSTEDLAHLGIAPPVPSAYLPAVIDAYITNRYR